MKYNEVYEDKAEILKVIAHPVRLCIIKGLIDQESNVTNMQECLGLPQSTISQHLSILRNRGIIKGHRKGLEVKYTVIDETVKKIMEVIE